MGHPQPGIPQQHAGFPHMNANNVYNPPQINQVVQNQQKFAFNNVANIQNEPKTTTLQV